MMADPLSITTGVIALVTFALTSSVNLYTTVRDFQSQDKKVRALKNELGDLTAVLQSLLDTVTSNPDIDFAALKAPLHRCGNACKEYGELISRFTSHSTASRSSVRDWITQKYLQGDINDFKEMLTGYKSTINIALANANIRVAAITPGVLEDYKDMIADTTQDLKEHLEKLEAKIHHLSQSNDQDPDRSGPEWHAIIEEKKSTQQGLSICSQLSEKIEQLKPASNEDSLSSQQPLAHKYIQRGLDATKGSIQSLVAQLHSHEDDIDKKMRLMASNAPASEERGMEMERLLETKNSIHQCIKVISDASDTAAVERHNVFEDITLADDAYNLTISTVGDLVTAKRINLTGRSLNVGGQISDESYQKTIGAFARQEIQQLRPVSQNLTQTTLDKDARIESGAGCEFQDRHGRGLKLSNSPEDSKGGANGPNNAR